MTTAETILTEFLRDPNTIVERNADDLRRSLNARIEAVETSVETVNRLLLTALADPAVRASLRSNVKDVPWLGFLPDRDRDAFFDDLFRTADGAADVGVMAPLGRLIREWRTTAQIHADPSLAEELRRPLNGDGDQIPEPPAEDVLG